MDVHLQLHGPGTSPGSERDDAPAGPTPLLQAKDYAAPSVFRPENMLREARRQKRLTIEDVPEICVLDPDGDLVRQLLADKRAEPCRGWACYHTDLYLVELAGERIGIVGCAVGASFAVLVAEQLFASGCRLLISLTSAGQIAPAPSEHRGSAPYFVLIDRALRDEGTSHHYLPPSVFVQADPALMGMVMGGLMMGGLAGGALTVLRGPTWTTDAPFRETAAAIEAARAHGVLAVEMEAAALYAFAQARGKSVICFAHVTNQMAQIDGDFEKGDANGAYAALDLLAATALAWRTDGTSSGA